MNLENRLSRVEGQVLPDSAGEAARRLGKMPDWEFYPMMFKAAGMPEEGAELVGIFQRAGMGPEDFWFPWSLLGRAEEARARALLEEVSARLLASMGTRRG